ncbi:DUF4397 domain-containing protein [Chitinophaga sp. 180180018-3]|uniref:DUF4397 domain-containing protein n=1 Tax=unclassified Chitinophaga TaxID=2619133 RepID=UPI0030D37516
MKNKLLILSSFILLTGAACHKTDYLDVKAGERPPLSANIRFVNARIADTGIQFWTFTQQVTTSPVLPGTASPYVTATYGNVQINVTEGSGTSYRISRQFGNSATYSATGGPNGPIPGYYHTVFAAATRYDNSKDTLILVYDDLTAPPAGKAKLRFVHLAYGLPAVKVSILQNGTTTPLSNAIPYGAASGSNLQGAAYDSAPFTNVNAGTIAVVINTGENNTPVNVDQQALSHLLLEEGKVYTVFIRTGVKGVVSASVISQ